MLSDEDIQKLIEASREVFATKEDLERMKEDLRKDFSNLQSTYDHNFFFLQIPFECL